MGTAAVRVTVGGGWDGRLSAGVGKVGRNALSLGISWLRPDFSLSLPVCFLFISCPDEAIMCIFLISVFNSLFLLVIFVICQLKYSNLMG